MSGRAHGLMVLGTASNVGKSLTVAALCRIFADDGVDVAPFKAQNMSLNAAVTPDGREIGRAQAVQAEAARRPAEVEMNPILLKPTGDRRSQVVLEGAIWEDVDAWDYHRRRTAELFPRVVAAYERLAARCELIVLEGAGSPAEINLKDRDIANLRMAEAADVPCLLLADVDRGGSFAALTGTIALLEPHERARIRAFALTKFRGDLELLRPGLTAMEERLGIPCAGVIPWIADHGIDEEDGYLRPPTPPRWPDETGAARRLRIAVLDLPFFANATDVDALAAEPSVVVRRVATPDELAGADLVVLPGSKETARDLAWLCARGFDAAIRAHAAAGRVVLGICGGMQMLGERLDDPHGIERGGSVDGLGLLPLTTTLGTRKTTVRVEGRLATGTLFGEPVGALAFGGYEIHVGVSERSGGAPWTQVRREGETAWREDGTLAGTVAGTYVHGLFDDDGFRHAALRALRARAGLAPPDALAPWRAQREGRYDRLAAVVRASLDVPLLARLAGLEVRV